MKPIRCPNSKSISLLLFLAIAPTPALAANVALLGWNNLGMHCMDSDYSVFSILPPYNTIEAQLVVGGKLVKTGAGYTVAYQAVADPVGSINASSVSKGNFYSYVAPLYGASLTPDKGLAGWDMPGPNNTPQSMLFESANAAAPGVNTPVNWFRAEGIPLTPYDDAGTKNPYPLMRLTAHDASGAVIASTQIVLPVSDEMDCRACHASGSGTAAQPAAGWVSDSNPERDYRLNILRFHDEREFAVNGTVYAAALAAKGYNPAGLYATVTVDAKPILCASCHESAALGTSSFAQIPSLTSSVHSFHANVVDPVAGGTLDSVHNRSACYRCHPGSTTKCLRGAMGAAVAPDGSMLMQCQSCHGGMSQVGSPARKGWLMEPGCQSCHTGTATHNNGQIRYTAAFESSGTVSTAVDQTFATTPNTPATGLSLFRFSIGHGGLQCEACHGSTHAEFPSSHLNDNLRNIQLQGYAGVLAECTACHVTSLNTGTGGPHGLHPLGQSWVSQHGNYAEHNSAQCQACHGLDYRGTVLSRTRRARTLVANSDHGTLTVQLPAGAQVGRYTCHNGPSGDESGMNTAPAPTTSDVTAATGVGQAVSFALPGSGAGITFWIVSQPSHGSVGLNNSVTTYTPEAGFSGIDSFTFAAYDGKKYSAEARATITVGTVSDHTPPTVTIVAPTPGPTYTATGQTVDLSGTASDDSQVVAVTWSNDQGGSGTANGTANWSANSIPLQPGVNVITVTARDATNKTSTDQLIVTSSADASLTVLITGQGKVTPNLDGHNVQAGKTYKMTAKPAADYVFANWTGSVFGNQPTITFVLSGNMVLQANFVPNPFTGKAGTYNGLFYESDAVTHINSGSVTVTVTSKGAFSGNVQAGGSRGSFSGQLSPEGKATVQTKRANGNSLTLTFEVSDSITGTVTDGSWVAHLEAQKSGFDGKTQVAPQAGRYTLAIPGSADSAAAPGGHGFATVTVDKAGRVRLAGTLADGTAISQAAALSSDARWPLYSALYAGKGSILSWVSFESSANGDLSGTVTWNKLPQANPKNYAAGFSLESSLAGSSYSAPQKGTTILNVNTGAVTLNGGDVPDTVTCDCTLDSKNHVTDQSNSKLKLTFSAPNGTFNGTVNPASSKPVSFKGVVLQKQNVGMGFFLGKDTSGSVQFEGR